MHLAAPEISETIALSDEQWHLLRPECFPCNLDARALLRRHALSTAQSVGVHVLPDALGPLHQYLVSILQLGVLFGLYTIYT